MKEIAIGEIIETAEALGKTGKWHFHMLGKDCKLNERKGKYAIVFESEGKETLVAIFQDKPLKQAKKLAELSYGEKFLEKQEKTGSNPDFDAIFKEAERMTAEGIEWHHHHLHAKCKFNEHKGKQCILLEIPKSQKTLIVIYDGSPMEDLVKIERLFYKDVR